MFIINNDNVFEKNHEEESKLLSNPLIDDLKTTLATHNSLFEILQHTGLDQQFNSLSLMSSKLVENISSYEEGTLNGDDLFIILNNLGVLKTILETIMISDVRKAHVIREAEREFIKIQLEHIEKYKKSNKVSNNDDSLGDGGIKYNVNRIKHLFED